MALGQGPQALLTTLYRSTDCLCRRGAAVKNLAQSASPHAGENNAPSKPGTKHLGPPYTPELLSVYSTTMNFRHEILNWATKPDGLSHIESSAAMAAWSNAMIGMVNWSNQAPGNLANLRRQYDSQ